MSIDVPQAREDVYDFLDVLANHELFTDHMLRDWRCEGPARGVGAKAKMTAVAGGRAEALDMEVIDADPPARTVERNVGTSGRVATGTYTLAELPGGEPGSASSPRGCASRATRHLPHRWSAASSAAATSAPWSASPSCCKPPAPPADHRVTQPEPACRLAPRDRLA